MGNIETWWDDQGRLHWEGFEKRPEGSKEVSHVAMWGRAFQA